MNKIPEPLRKRAIDARKACAPKGLRMNTNECEYCAYYSYDEEDEEYYCDVYMDEDDMARMSMKQYKSCPYYKNGDEYAVVRKQN